MVKKTLKQKAFSWLRGDENDGLGATRAYSVPYLPLSQNDADNSSIVASVYGWAKRNIVQARPIVEQEKLEGDELVVGHPVSELVRYPQRQIVREERSNLTYRRLMQGVVWSLIFDGNAYLQKVRNSRGQVIGLDWFAHTAIQPEFNRTNAALIDRYWVNRGYSRQEIAPENIVHITDGVDPQRPCMGCSQLKAVMRNVMADNLIAVFSHAVLRAPNPSMLLSSGNPDNSFSSEQAEELVEMLSQSVGGERYGGAIAFGQPVKVDKLNYSPADLALGELAKLHEERITAALGLPAIIAGMGAGLERSTFSNYEQAQEAAFENFLMPYWDLIGEGLSEALLPDFGIESGFILRLDYAGVKALQEDTDALQTRSRENFKANLWDRAKALSAIGEEPTPEDEGVYFYQLRGPSEIAPRGDEKGRTARAEAERV